MNSLNVYFFIQSGCVPCSREKLELCQSLFEKANHPNVLILESESDFNLDSIPPKTYIIREERDILKRKGLDFTSPVVCKIRADSVEWLEIDLSFIDHLDSMKFVLNH